MDLKPILKSFYKSKMTRPLLYFKNELEATENFLRTGFWFPLVPLVLQEVVPCTVYSDFNPRNQF